MGPGEQAEPAPEVARPPAQRAAVTRQGRLFFLALLATIGFLTWMVFKPFLIYMVMGVFIAVLALPLDKFFERKLPNRFAAVCTMTVIFIIVTAPIVSLGFALFQDAQEVAADVQAGEVENFIATGLEIVYPDQTQEERNETLQDLWLQFKPRVTNALQSLAGRLVGFVADFVIALVIILFVVYYVLVDGERLVAYLRRALPLPGSQVGFLMHEANQGLRAVFVGQILTSLIQGSLGGIGFLIVQLPGAVLWAAVMAILSLLPVVGAFLVWLPAAVYLLVIGKVWQGIFLIIWGAGVVSQIDNFVRPKLIGDRADIHPMFVLIGVLGGVAAFGFVGLFLGPLLVGVLISVLKVWESDYLDPSAREAPAGGDG